MSNSAAIPTRVVFRVDGNARIGLGHRTRCQALAGILVGNGFVCVWATRDPLPPAMRTGLPGPEWLIPATLPLLAEPAWLAERLLPGDILVLDGYDFTDEYQRLCLQSGRGLVCFDDFAAGRVWGDVVINAAGGVAPARYAALAEPGAQLCLGPGYALLRPAFWQAQQLIGSPPDADRIFLNMGGADPDNHTLRLLPELVSQYPHKQLDVVTGAAYPHQSNLAAAAASWPNVRLHHNLDATALANLLQRCGVYLCPPSGMAYECCALGGLLLLHRTADNQQLLFDYLTSNGLALPYAELPALPETQWPVLAAAMREQQRQVFDPAQVNSRFGQAFAALAQVYRLQVRRAASADAPLYLAWANDPAVRGNAIQPAPIAWPTHLAWFERRLTDPDSYLYLLAEGGHAVGQVRIEFAEATGLIDYSVAEAHRGRGLGLAILRRALGELRCERPAPWVLRGEVKAGNDASARVFERLGFARLAPVQHGAASFEVFELAVNSAF